MLSDMALYACISRFTLTRHEPVLADRGAPSDESVIILPIKVLIAVIRYLEEISRAFRATRMRMRMRGPPFSKSTGCLPSSGFLQSHRPLGLACLSLGRRVRTKFY